MLDIEDLSGLALFDFLFKCYRFSKSKDEDCSLRLQPPAREVIPFATSMNLTAAFADASDVNAVL